MSPEYVQRGTADASRCGMWTNSLRTRLEAHPERSRTMTDRAFRFGVVASPDRGAAAWQTTVRRAADLGYSTVLMPDGLQLLSPFPSLAVAAATADIRVGTFVAAAPLRAPRAAAWDAHTLTVLTEGRFEFGIGTGRPGVEEFAAELGLPFGSAKERRDQVRETLDQLEKLDGEQHTPIMLVAGGVGVDAARGAHAAGPGARGPGWAAGGRHRAGDEPVRRRDQGTAAVDEAGGRSGCRDARGEWFADAAAWDAAGDGGRAAAPAGRVRRLLHQRERHLPGRPRPGDRAARREVGAAPVPAYR